MTVAATDLKYYLSGGGTNAVPASSLGGAISTTLVGTDLFDNITSAEAAAGDDEYRGVYIKNTNATDTAFAVKVWVQSNTPSTDTEIQIALADEGVSATMETVANESTAPTGPTFSTADGEANALSIGNLTAGQYYGIWIKRSVSATATAYANDTVTLRVKADTTS